ncbi:MAG: SDR family NAD(P)-dependent oxidoreductase, partial [Bdellovibrionales bacterium]|nr:SDR family NAD(P)-dependent oxidoreductase [Bdellovibrionales bacterium]
MLVARRADRLKEIQTELSKKTKVIVCELDITDSQAVDKFVASQSEWLTHIDVLINNAGLALGREPFQDSKIEDAEAMLATNILALLRFTHKVLPNMIKKKSGHILNMGSIAGKTAYQSGTVYCATKAAVHMITEALRIDLGGTGVRVSTVAPGRVAETEFSVVRFKGDEDKARQVYEGYRTMSSKDVAEAIAWILDRPSNVNIQELVIMPTDQPSATMLAPVR